MQYFFVFVFIFVLGCSQNYNKYVNVDSNITIDSDLKKRYLEYWLYKSEHNFEEAYKYELPYLNFVKNLEWYKEFNAESKKHFATNLLKIDINKKDTDIVYIRSNFKAKYLDSNVTEKWIKVNGTWFHYYSQSLLPELPQ